MKLVERMPSVCNAVIKAKVRYFEKSQIFFWLLHDSICYFIVLMFSLLFYNVEKSKKLRKSIERGIPIQLYCCWRLGTSL